MEDEQNEMSSTEEKSYCNRSSLIFSVLLMCVFVYIFGRDLYALLTEPAAKSVWDYVLTIIWGFVVAVLIVRFVNCMLK